MSVRVHRGRWYPLARCRIATLDGMSPEIGRVLLVVGLLIAGVGLLAMLGVRIPLGRLPGDIHIGDERGGVYIPLASGLLISIVLSVVLSLALRR